MATTPIKSMDQLNQTISRLGRRLQLRANREARAEALVARKRQQLDDAINGLAELNRRDGEGIQRDGAAIFSFVEPIWDELSGNKSEAKVVAGMLVRRHREIGALEFLSDEATTIAEIKAKFPELASELIKTTENVRKDVLKKSHPQVLAALDSAVAGSVDTLSIQPANTALKLTLPFRTFRSWVEKLNLA